MEHKPEHHQDHVGESEQGAMVPSGENPFFVEFSEWFELLSESLPLIERLFKNGHERHGVAQGPPGDQHEWLRDIPDRGRPPEDIFRDLDLKLNRDGSNSWSGQLFGHIPSGAAPITAIADLISSVSNRYTGLLEGTRGGVAIHNDLVRWFCDLFGLGPDAWGNIQGGGSLATMTALVAARDTRARSRWGDMVVYVTDQAHGCISRALHIMGVSPDRVRLVECDGAQRMSASDLRDKIGRDRQVGLVPWLLCATAGTTNTGAIDPLESLAAIAEAESLWFHVDAAYGGPFILTDTGAARFNGIARADSIVVDPHKGFFVPFGVGVVLVKRKSDLQRSFSPESPYIQDDLESKELSPYYYSAELSRQFRSLRLWFTLQFHGRDTFARALQHRLEWARWAYRQLVELPGLEVMEPQLTIIAFRLHDSDGDTRALLDRILRRGRISLSVSSIDGRDWMRACILHVNTTFRAVETMVEEITISIEHHDASARCLGQSATNDESRAPRDSSNPGGTR